MAKKRATRKSSTRSEPPLPPKDSSVGKTPSAGRSSSQSESTRMYDRQVSDLRARLQNMKGEGMSSAGRKDPTKAIRAMEVKIESMTKNAPKDSRYSLNTAAKSNISVPRLPDKLSGRTSEFGTRSMLEGMKSWMRGGGGFRRGSM
jgi:hypothetical protein